MFLLKLGSELTNLVNKMQTEFRQSGMHTPWCSYTELYQNFFEDSKD